MRFPHSITALKSKNSLLFFSAFRILVFVCIFLSANYAQKISVFAPVGTLQSKIVVEKITTRLSAKLKITDTDLTKIVFQNAQLENPFNLSTEEARNFGNAVGCDYFLFVRSENIRRVSLSKDDYYESFAALHLISSRTGKMVFWSLNNAEAVTPEEADKKLFVRFSEIEKEILPKIAVAQAKDFADLPPKLEEPPDANSPDAKNFRIPLPFRRVRPAYTPQANLYSVTATIDASVDLDETGKITRFEIIRSAGYGLDESVEKTVREMQWRPAARNGKPLPIRILLRYNFKKIED